MKLKKSLAITTALGTSLAALVANTGSGTAADIQPITQPAAPDGFVLANPAFEARVLQQVKRYAAELRAFGDVEVAPADPQTYAATSGISAGHTDRSYVLSDAGGSFNAQVTQVKDSLLLSIFESQGKDGGVRTLSAFGFSVDPATGDIALTERPATRVPASTSETLSPSQSPVLDRDILGGPRVSASHLDLLPTHDRTSSVLYFCIHSLWQPYTAVGYVVVGAELNQCNSPAYLQLEIWEEHSYYVGDPFVSVEYLGQWVDPAVYFYRNALHNCTSVKYNESWRGESKAVVIWPGGSDAGWLTSYTSSLACTP